MTQSQPSRNLPGPVPAYIAWAAAIAAVCTIGWLYCSTWQDVARAHASVAYEAHEYYLAAQLARGSNIYDPAWLQRMPFIVNIYTPVYTAACSLGMLLFGRTIVVARALTFICCVGSAGLLVRSAIKCGASLPAALVSTTLFLSFIPVWFHSTLTKPDLMALLFSAAAVLFIIENEERPRNMTLSIAALLFACAVYTKQSGLAALLGANLSFLERRQWRSAFTLNATFGAVCAVALLGLQICTGGFWQHITFVGRLPLDWRQAELTLTALGIDALKIAIAVVILLIDLLAQFAQRRRSPQSVSFIESARQSLCVSLVLATSVFGLIALGTPDSSYNQLIFALYFFCLWLAVATKKWFACVAISVLACVAAVDTQRFMHGFTAEIASNWQQTRSALSTPGIKLLEDPFWYVETDTPAQVVGCNALANYWRIHPESEKALILLIEKRAFSQAMINRRDFQGQSSQNWTGETLAVLRANYHEVALGTGNGLHQCILLPNVETSNSGGIAK